MDDFFRFLSQEWMLVGILVVLIYVYAWRERLKNGRPVTTSEATALINTDAAIWLDVRDASEFKSGHMVDAINIPHGKLAEQMDSLEKYRDKVLIVVDKMGQHAGSAGRQLGNKGFDVRRLSGGISEWRNQSLPLVKK
ncbi:rhodanese-like domain-containing protein [Gilvimarinus algae]